MPYPFFTRDYCVEPQLMNGVTITDATGHLVEHIPDGPQTDAFWQSLKGINEHDDGAQANEIIKRRYAVGG